MGSAGAEAQQPPRHLVDISRRGLLGGVSAAAAVALAPPAATAATAAPKVVVVGGSGYVGSYALKLLAQQGAQVVAVSRRR